MNNVYLVLTIEYLRRLRFYWLMVVFVFVGGPLGFLGLLWLNGLTLSPTVVGQYDYMPLYAGLSLLILPLLALSMQRQIYPHLYLRPISTWALAGWLMATGVVTIAATNVLILLAYRLLLGARWPILAPTLFFMSFMLLAQSLHWNLLRATYFKLLAALAAIAGAGWWFVRRFHPDGLTKRMEPWFTPSADEMAIMLAGSAAAVGLGIYGLSRARHEWEGNKAPQGSADMADPYVSSRVPRLSEVSQSLNWFFWRRGMLYAIGAAGSVTLSMALPFAFSQNDLFPPGYDLESLAGMSFFVPLMCCAIIGVALGLDIRHPAGFHLMSFLSTRPVSTVQLSKSLLWNAFKSTLVAWGLVILGLAVYAALSFLLRLTPAARLAEFQQSKIGIAAVALTLAGSFLISWTALSWLAVLGWSGREKFYMLAVFLIIGVPALFVLFVQFAVPVGWGNFLKGVGLWLPAISIPILTYDWTVAARRGNLLSDETLLLLAILAVFLVAFFGILVPAPPAGKILACLYATAALLPIPAAPLMLEWNRHR